MFIMALLDHAANTRRLPWFAFGLLMFVVVMVAVVMVAVVMVTLLI